MHSVETDDEAYDHVYPFVRGSLVFDVGAHIGEVTRKFLDKGAIVVAFEPQTKLTTGSNFQGALAVHNVCLADAPRDLVFYRVQDRKVSAIDSCFSGWKALHPNRKWKGEIVTASTLDLAIAEHGIPVYIKIDVEGFEDQVLQGLNTSVRFISFEYTSKHRDHFVRCIDRLRELGAVEMKAFLKQKIKGNRGGRRVVLRAFKRLTTFDSLDQVIPYYDSLRTPFQGDMLVRAEV